MQLPDLNELDDIFLTIEEDDGSETECQLICLFEHKEKAYAALTPVDENIAEAYLFAAEIEAQGDELEFTISNIDDEALMEELGEVFTSIMEEAEADEGIPDISEDLKGISVSTEDPDPESHQRIISPGNDSDSYWDQFINKKLEDL